MISIICSLDSIQNIIILHFSNISIKEDEKLFFFNLDVSLSKQKMLENFYLNYQKLVFPYFQDQ